MASAHAPLKRLVSPLRKLPKLARRTGRAIRRLQRRMWNEVLGLTGHRKTHAGRWIRLRRKALRERRKQASARMRPLLHRFKRGIRWLSPNRLRHKATARFVRARESVGTYTIERRTLHEVAAVHRGQRPVVVGPWTTEVGFEALYWLPFVNWFARKYKLDRQRLIAVSRGGVADWYTEVAARYVELFDLMTPNEYADKSARRRDQADGAHKQYEVSDLDREILAATREHLGLRRIKLLHPSLMYRLFHAFWYGRRPFSVLDRHQRYFRHRVEPPSADWGLPVEYSAVKFYTAASMPHTEENRRVVQRVIERLARVRPVVLLETGLSLDDHDEFESTAGGRIINARDLMRPGDNLGVQTRIISGAQSFVGTCGSVAWLAPMLGVDTVATFSDPRLLHNHLTVALGAYLKIDGAGRFMPVNVDGLQAMGLMSS